MTEATIVGEKKQIESQIKYYKNELKSNYFDIENEYLDKLVSYQSLEFTHSDLEKYIKALDNAIMKYHSLKMQEINKIIRELWINTYMANDIDTIEIRSESETAKNNRSYNYRVVMIKGGQAIDMRGRCSAGQKVLASLIIRLALAESFALNCGILALDEPTTNLDKANIESLAHSLSKIIAMRQNKSNFQFVIITHDLEFLDMLGKSDLTDYYWRVYKNQEQFSSVEKVSFIE
ncbi:DNA repair protein RAD50 [Smittium culicis]|uniref:DNA repair protein RAD50 n=1 Tax=Smittium culicis TaxID=133412 RepID=A0A1R1XNE8_9FUNG|nr:DNA repair protein RAD50 [Smittium culicis]